MRWRCIVTWSPLLPSLPLLLLLPGNSRPRQLSRAPSARSAPGASRYPRPTPRTSTRISHAPPALPCSLPALARARGAGAAAARPGGGGGTGTPGQCRGGMAADRRVRRKLSGLADGGQDLEARGMPRYRFECGSSAGRPARRVLKFVKCTEGCATL